MEFKKLAVYALGGLAAIAIIGAMAAPKVSAAIRGSFVEMIIPTHPFQASVYFNNTPVTVGPDTGTLGVTNITLTNYDSAPQQVYLFQPIFTTGGCGTGTPSSAAAPQMQVYVQPHQTLVLPFPSPLVFSGAQGHTCVGAEVTSALNGGSVEIDVSGFVN